MHSRACEPGERLTADGLCLVCDVGQYLLEPVTQVTESCKDCIAEAYCKGGNKISPRAGYWRSNLTSENFLTCFRHKSCQSTEIIDDIDDYLGKCETGYQGKICGECNDGYVRRALMVCEKCKSWFKVKNNAIFLLFQVFFIIFVLSYLNIKNADSTKPTF